MLLINFVTTLLLYIGSGKTSLFAIYPFLGTFLPSLLILIHKMYLGTLENLVIFP